MMFFQNLHAVLLLIHRLVQKGRLLMALVEDFRHKLREHASESQQIAARMGALIALIQSDSLTPAQEAQAFTDLADLVQQLKAVGEITPYI